MDQKEADNDAMALHVASSIPSPNVLTLTGADRNAKRVTHSGQLRGGRRPCTVELDGMALANMSDMTYVGDG